jgi:hypothetical protein
LGKVISLEKGSTPIDFAYAVHTNLGHRCRGARVDGAMVPLETALQNAISGTTISVNEFTVAPQITPKNGLPYHEWLIEFDSEPEDLEAFAQKIDAEMRQQNVYYDDLIKGHVLRTIVIKKVAKNGFQDYMKSIGKLGGQNKLPRLSNDRKIADFF